MDAFATSTHRFMDISILVPLPPNLVNRDDTGRPKTTTHGGVLRLSPSPQNFKLGHRRSSEHGQYLIRSKWLPAIILNLILNTNPDNKVPEKAQHAIYEAIRDALFNNTANDEEKKAKKAGKPKKGKKGEEETTSEAPAVDQADPAVNPEQETDEDPRKTAALMLVTREEIDALVEKMSPLVKAGDFDKTKLSDAAEEAFATCRRTSQALARSLYGRMVTNSKCDEHRDGALQIGFPFSAERARVQTDYFSATDDLNKTYAQTDKAQGSSHIGERPFAGGHTILVHAQIDLDLLAVNARFDSLREALATHREDIINLVLDVVRTMVTRPFANAAGQGSFRTSPRACFALVRTSKEGCLYDLAPAFELPVVGTGDKAPSQVATERLIEYAEKTRIIFGEGEDYAMFDMSDTVDAFVAEVRLLVQKVIS